MGDGIASIVRDIGTETRRRICKLPKSEQSIAWAAVASAITGAAVHDSLDPDKVISMVEATMNAMLTATLIDVAEE